MKVRLNHMHTTHSVTDLKDSVPLVGLSTKQTDRACLEKEEGVEEGARQRWARVELPPSVKGSISEEYEEGGKTTVRKTKSWPLLFFCFVYSRALMAKTQICIHIAAHTHTHTLKQSCSKQDNWSMPLKVKNSIMLCNLHGVQLQLVYNE